MTICIEYRYITKGVSNQLERLFSINYGCYLNFLNYGLLGCGTLNVQFEF